MSLVQPYINNLEQVSSKMGEIAVQALTENLDFVLYLIKEEQLSKGLDARGKVVGTYERATKAYADQDRQASSGRYPRQEKNPGDPYNFDWFGGFKDGIYVKIGNGEYDILSRDGKSALLEQKYGKLLKLTNEHNKMVNEQVIRPALYNYLFDNMVP